MNKQEKYMDDLLKQYIAPERFENAPEGLTSKIMTRIQYDKISEMSRTSKLVPIISTLVTILFMVTALLLPESKTDYLPQLFVDFLKNLTSTHMLDLSSIFRHTLPSVTLYVFIGILSLTLLDKALHGIFRKEK